MFARLTITQSKLDKFDESVKIYEESVIPVAKSQKATEVFICLLTEKQAKVFLSPYGIVKQMPLPMKRVGTTRNK